MKQFPQHSNRELKMDSEGTEVAAGVGELNGKGKLL